MKQFFDAGRTVFDLIFHAPMCKKRLISLTDYVSPRPCGDGTHALRDCPDVYISSFSDAYLDYPKGTYGRIADEASGFLGCVGRSDLLRCSVNWDVLAETLLWNVEMYVRDIK